MPGTLYWTVADVNQTKKRVRDTIERHTSQKSKTQRIQIISRKIREYAGKSDPQGILMHVIYCISALFHHSRFGGLQDRQIERLASIVDDLLRVSGVKPPQSKVAFLYGELYSVLSQIERTRGMHWQSIWLQKMAVYYSGSSSQGGDGYVALASGIRFFRLGFLDKALDLLQSIDSQTDLPIRDKVLAQLISIRCYRLAGRFDLSTRLSEEIRDECNIPEDYAEELHWEEQVRKVRSSGDINELYLMTKSGKKFDKPGYLIEFMLRAYALPNKKYLKKLPSLDYLVRKRKLKLRQQGFSFKALTVLRDCYDTDIPYQIRLRNLGNIQRHISGFVSLELKLLFMIASARFLIRSRAQDMAELILLEYSRSVQFEGKSIKDPLGLLSD